MGCESIAVGEERSGKEVMVDRIADLKSPKGVF